MSNTRNLADLLDSSGDIKSAALDNVDVSGKLDTSGGTLTGTLTMESTDAGSTAAPELILYRNSASPADGDYLGQVQFKGENDNGGSEIYAKVTGKITDASNGTEDGLIETAIKGNGSFTIVSRQKSDELQLLNGVNLNVDGNITVGGTVDGVDIQTLNTTAGAALPKAGGAMTGDLTVTDSDMQLTTKSAIGTAEHEAGGGFSNVGHATQGSRRAMMWLDADGANFGGSDYYYIEKTGGGGVQHILQNSGDMKFATNGTERMRINSSGNVGIGNTVAGTINGVNSSILTIGSGSGHSGMTVYTGATNEGTISFADGTSGSATYKGMVRYDHNTNNLTLHTDSSERMNINANGNIGIGESTPIRKVVIAGSSGNSSTLLLHMDADTAGGECGIEFKADSTNDDRRVKAAIKYRRDDPGTRGTGNLHFCVNGDNNDVNVSTSHSRMMLNTDGLHFNGDTAAANALDDYEEGTCSIQWSDGNNVTGNANNAFYTKVGRIVTVSGDIMSSGVSSLTQSAGLKLVGFPFNFSKNGTAPILTRNLDVPSGTINVVIYHAGNGSFAEVYSFTDHGAYSNATVGDLHGSTNDMYFTVTYQTT